MVLVVCRLFDLSPSELRNVIIAGHKADGNNHPSVALTPRSPSTGNLKDQQRHSFSPLGIPQACALLAGIELSFRGYIEFLVCLICATVKSTVQFC